MNVILSEEQSAFRETAERFLASESPVASVRAWAEQPHAYSADYWKKAADLGWTSVLLPEALGGPGAEDPVVILTIVAEQMGRFVAPGPLLACNVVADVIVRSGSDEQQRDYLSGIADGSMTASWAFAEDDQWDASAVATSVRRQRGGYVLNGSKFAVEAADTADVFLVTAASDSGLVQVLVPGDADGVYVDSLSGYDVGRRFGAVAFTDVQLAPEHVLGDQATVDEDVEHQLFLALAIQCAEMVGLMDHTFAATVEYMQTRYTFGRPLVSYQALKHRLANHKAVLETALGVASALTQAVNDDDPDAAELASVAKAYIGDEAVALVSDCAQLIGGVSMTWEHDLHHYLRRATVDRFLYGSPAHHRERLCRLVGV